MEMAAEQSAAIFLFAAFQPGGNLVAALFPVVMNLDLMAHGVMVVVSESRADCANGDCGERQGKQNLLHGGFLGRIDRVGGRFAILARAP